MEDLVQILVSGLTLGAMYAVASAGLCVAWGSLNLLNMAHGALLALGGYAAYAVSTHLGTPLAASVLLAVAAGAGAGVLLQVCVVRPLTRRPNYEVNAIVATVGVGFIVENLILKLFGAYPVKQPGEFGPGWTLAGVHVPASSILILASGAAVLLLLSWFMDRTRQGRAIRAVSQHREAARLMGVPVDTVFLCVMALAGGLSAASGVMLSLVTTLSPAVGHDPMLKAFIVCVLAGLGHLRGTLVTAFAIGLLEAWIQYALGVRFALPVLLLLVIAALVWRPTGLFGRQEVVRL
jgi:branched-chain amino acid transport system permease protein